ncbi:hypothetical protein [Sandaracinus amylolyticus]|uniref:hypothetical protein n=1 Tax=Sandaracinus amylolyticus TaxID=927083 RepID=UPI001F34DD68|nr:hypothetical protein [Sandaracinus amylolyticus]UJR80229.1 Hypothetical protein I5071_22730 [Sandaracinus amylolyticus]
MRAFTPVALGVALLVLGCATSARVRRDGRVHSGVVTGGARLSIERASREIPCRREDLVVEDLGSGGYRVVGCGSVMTYTCLGNGFGGGVCELNERRYPERDLAPPVHRGDTWTDGQVRELRATIHDEIMRCVPEGTDSVRLQLALSPRGEVRRIGRSQVDAAAGRCIDDALSRAQMLGTASEQRVVVMDFQRTQSVAAAPAAVTPMPATVPVGPDGAARAAVDTRAPSILACVEAEAIAMQVSWTAEGRLDVLLRGDRQGTPEESCVRAIVQQLTIPAPGAAGTIVHAVQR